MNISRKIFRSMMQISALGILFFAYMGSVSAADIISSGENNCKRIDTVDFGNGYSLKHYTFSYSTVKNIGRTELYYNDVLKEYQDTVFLANGGVIWWYEGGACLAHSRLASVDMTDDVISITYDYFNPRGYSSTTNNIYDSKPTFFSTTRKNITDISVSVYAFGFGVHNYIKLNLTDSNINESSNIASQGFLESILDLGGASSGTRLSSSKRYGTNGCNIDEVIQVDLNYEIHYTCNVYHYKSSSSINGPAVTTNGSKTGVFILPIDDYNLCSYENDFCESLFFNYSTPPENNTSEQTSQNTYGTPYSLEYTLSLELNVENEEVASEETQVSNDAGDPVRLETGEFEYDNTVMRVPSEGMPFSFDIRYKNQAYYNGPIGHNFDFSYNKYIREDADGDIYFHDGKFGIFKFEKGSDGTFAYNTTLDATLTQTGATFEIIVDGKMTYLFGENQKISSITDAHNNSMSFEYNEENQLINIVDTQNRAYTLSYYDHSRLSAVTDFSGNAVVFEYFGADDADGGEYDLQNIILQNAGEEKTISFNYTQSDVYEDAHNITKLIDAKGQVYVENTYQDDRVISQKYGNGSISYDYTLSGALVRENLVTDRNGNITNYVFDDAGNTLSRTKDSLTYSYEYNDAGKLVKEILPKGNGYTYSYDINGNLLEKRQKENVHAASSSSDIVTSYEYDLVFNTPTKITLPNGLETSYTLDDLGNVISSRSSGIDSGNGDVEQENSFVYDNNGQIISTTDSYAVMTEFVYSGSLLISQVRGGVQSIHYSYDEYGNILTKTDALGNVTSYSYDEFYNLQTETTAEGIETQYSYDANNNKLETEIVFGSENALTQVTYNLLDKPSKISQKISQSQTSETQMYYDANENVIKTIFPNGAKKEFTYDSYDRVLTEKVIADGEISVTSNTYDANGNLISQNINGDVSQLSYDLFDRLTELTDPLGNTTSYSYDSMGNMIETKNTDNENTVLSHTTLVYNEINKVLSQTQISGSDARTMYFTYDVAGNLISQTDAAGNVSNYSYDSLMRLTQQTDANGLVSQTSYDLADRIISKSIISSDTTLTTSYVYNDDGQVISQSDTEGNITSYTYNQLGQVTSMVDAHGIPTNYSYDYRGKKLSESREGRVLNYEYDLMGNMTQLIDAEGNITEYLYNEKGNRTRETHDDGTFYEFIYDYEGKLISEIDPNGSQRDYSYDELNRIITKDISSTGIIAGVGQENYSYDGLGRLQTADNDLGVELEFSYNQYGELTSESQNVGIGVQTVSYSYDTFGNTSEIIYPSGSLLERSYDETSRLVGLELDGQQILTSQYNDLYKIAQNYGNGRSTSYTYDSLGRLAGLDAKSYSYDAVGNILSDGDDNYAYDTLNRLESITYGSTPWENYTSRSYDYDLMGNRNKETLYYKNSKGKTRNRSFLYDTNALNNTTYRAYEKDIKFDFGSLADWESRDETIDTKGKQVYDANGNLVQSFTSESSSSVYHYDGNNRLIQVEKHKESTDGSTSITLLTKYSYDPLGRRVQKIGESGRKTFYTYAGQQGIQEKIYGSGSATPFLMKELIFTDQIDQLIASKNTTLTTGDTALYYFESNHLGSIESVYDSAAGLVETYEYDVFGQVISRDATGAKQKIKNATSANTRLFTGREYDQEILLYYNRARYYDPQMGKFISRDPIGIADDVNLYGYVGNSPVGYTDVFGKAAKAFVKAYDEYLFLKNKIAKVQLFDPMLQEKQNQELLSQYLVQRNKARTLHYARNKYNTNLPELEFMINRDSAAPRIGELDSTEWKKLSLVRSWYHQQTVPLTSPNTKYVSVDGHKEVIYNASGERVDNIQDIGTYNFFHPLAGNGLHARYDVDPYYAWGNGFGDTTTEIERRTGF